VGEYRHETKYGPVDIFTKSIDDGWVAYLEPDQLSVSIPPDDGPIAFLEDEAVDRLLKRIERS
jgi:hypothetical protein